MQMIVFIETKPFTRPTNLSMEILPILMHSFSTLANRFLCPPTTHHFLQVSPLLPLQQPSCCDDYPFYPRRQRDGC